MKLGGQFDAYGRNRCCKFLIVFYESELDAPKGLRNINLQIGPLIIEGKRISGNLFLPGRWSGSKLNRNIGLRKRVIGVSSHWHKLSGGTHCIEKPIF